MSPRYTGGAQGLAAAYPCARHSGAAPAPRLSAFASSALVVVSIGGGLGAGVFDVRPAFADALDAGALLRQQERLEGSFDTRALPEAEEEIPPPPPLSGSGELTLVLRDVIFTGDVELLPAEVLEDVVAEAIGMVLDFEGLMAVTERVTRALKDAGWILARAYLPQQDVTEGVLTIAILGGRLDDEGDPYRVGPAGDRPLRINPQRLERIASQKLQAGELVSEPDLNHAILIMNELPAVQAGAVLEPGDAPGSSRILIAAEQGPVFSSGVTLTNYGSALTGEAQLTVSSRFDDPFGLGDSVAISATLSEGQRLGSLTYVAPVGYDGTTFSARGTLLSYSAKSSEGIPLRGEAMSARFGVDRPVVRSVDFNSTLSAALDLEKSKDFVDSQRTRDRTTQVASVSFSGDRLDDFWTRGQTAWSATLSLGRNRTEPKGWEGFGKLDVQVSRTQVISETSILSVNLRGQLAGSNLDSSQKLSPGGPSAVRAYGTNEPSGDEGLIMQLSYRYTPELPELSGQLALAAFYDQAWLRLHHDPSDPVIDIDNVSGRNSYALKGVGLSATYSFTNGGYIQAVLAQPIGRNQGAPATSSSRRGSSKLWLQAGLRF